MKRFLCILMVCFWGMTILCSGCGEDSGNGRQNHPVQSVDTAMGTIISQTIYGAEDGNVTEEILRTITELEQESLSWRLESSEVYAINANAGETEEMLLSEKMTDILKECLEVSRLSEGTFDITIGEIVRLWDIDTWAGVKDVSGYKLPNETEIQQRLADTGYEKLKLDGSTLYLPEKMQLDLGAVGKGIALDDIREYLEQRTEVTGAVISVGGSILTYGTKPDGSPWRVGVVNPADATSNLGYVELKGTWCVSTSGDYERYVEIDGTRYHHIIDPATGWPSASGLKGVTILTEDGLLSDALSTACFILGQEKGSRLVEAFDAEALFVDEEGNISMTDGMEQYFHLSK